MACYFGQTIVSNQSNSILFGHYLYFGDHLCTKKSTQTLNCHGIGNGNGYLRRFAIYIKSENTDHMFIAESRITQTRAHISYMHDENQPYGWLAVLCALFISVDVFALQNSRAIGIHAAHSQQGKKETHLAQLYAVQFQRVYYKIAIDSARYTC